MRAGYSLEVPTTVGRGSRSQHGYVPLARQWKAGTRMWVSRTPRTGYADGGGQDARAPRESIPPHFPGASEQENRSIFATCKTTPRMVCVSPYAGPIRPIRPIRITQVQTWRMLMDPAMAAEGFTRLTYEIEATPGGATKLTIIHDLAGAPSLAAVVAGEFENEGAGGGWSWVLSDLKSLIETGTRLAG